jgi:coproporphyrinogen III oxidase
MSLPPLAGWEYDYHPVAGTPEDITLQKLKQGIDWI